MTGEFDFIEWIKSQQTPSDLVKVPVGDDLAVLNWPKDELLLVGADQVIDGVHFDSAVHMPRQIGRKAMNRNLSDCAAMACLPAAAVVTVALPKGVPVEYAKELYLGLKEAADVFNCPIVGGDTSTWNGKLVLSVTIMGRHEGIKPITRGGALPGDGIYVTGPLGGSILGREMTFKPRVREARIIARSGAHAMLDLSDGLSRDLRHICKLSRVGATIESSAVPIHSDAHAMFVGDKISPLNHALHDGEDYELLVIMPPQKGKREDLMLFDAGQRTPLIWIGECTQSESIVLQKKDALEPLQPRGWQHSF